VNQSKSIRREFVPQWAVVVLAVLMIAVVIGFSRFRTHCQHGEFCRWRAPCWRSGTMQSTDRKQGQEEHQDARQA
jgi:hypothetical protein